MILVLVLLSVLCTTLHAQEIDCTTDGVTVKKRIEWGIPDTTCGKPLDFETSKVSKIIIHQTGGATCNGLSSSCNTRLQEIRTSHITDRNLKDIAYNFLIDADGIVYEGRGWRTLGYYARYYAEDVLSIAFIGDFSDAAPTRLAQDAALQLIQCGKTNNVIIPSGATLEGFHDLETVCPDTKLGEAIDAGFP